MTRTLAFRPFLHPSCTLPAPLQPRKTPAMRLTDWAIAPLTSGPPPIPLTTDTVNSTNNGYRVGAIPPEAIAADLAALGLTYSPGRGHGYKLRGERVDAYAVGDLIADIFTEAAELLAYFLDTDDAMLAIAATEAEHDRIPYHWDDETLDARRAVRRRIEAAEAALPIRHSQLLLAAESLAETGRGIRGFYAVRTEAIRRFRAVIPAPARASRLSTATSVDAFLASVPAGDVARPALYDDAVAAGVEAGSRTVYAAADALGWPVVTRRGVRFYRVP